MVLRGQENSFQIPQGLTPSFWFCCVILQRILLLYRC